MCGKGAGAAVVTSLARYTLRAAAVHDPDPVAVLTKLNAALHREQHRAGPPLLQRRLRRPRARRPSGCDVVLATGGHPPPVLIRADGTVGYEHMPGGQVVGLLPEATFVRTALHLGPGDTLLLYTDGLTEARVDRAERYEEEALLEFLTAQAPTSAPDTVAAVRRLLDGFGDGLDDDTAVLAVSVAVGAAVGVPASGPGPVRPG